MTRIIGKTTEFINRRLDILLLLFLFRTVRISTKCFRVLPGKLSFQKAFSYFRGKKLKGSAFEWKSFHQVPPGGRCPRSPPHRLSDSLSSAPRPGLPPPGFRSSTQVWDPCSIPDSHGESSTQLQTLLRRPPVLSKNLSFPKVI